MKTYALATVCAMVMLAACGKRDASGIYVYSDDHEVIMVQVIQSDDGKITGRVQSDFSNVDGNVTEKSVPADGAISGDDLVLKPSSALLGGVQASGTLNGSNLTLTGENFTFTAARSSLEDFQSKVAALKTAAAEQRQKVAVAKVGAAQAQAQAYAQRNLAAQAKQVSDRVADMRALIARLSAAINRSPDFGQAAAANTAKIAQMANAAPSLASVARGQLGVAASQVEVNTNQIEVQRTQYANRLNRLEYGVADDLTQIGRVCGTSPAPQLAAPCESARAAIGEYKVTDHRGRARFSPYKAQVQAELAKQDRLIARIEN